MRDLRDKIGVLHHGLGISVRRCSSSSSSSLSKLVIWECWVVFFWNETSYCSSSGLFTSPIDPLFETLLHKGWWEGVLVFPGIVCLMPDCSVSSVSSCKRNLFVLSWKGNGRWLRKMRQTYITLRPSAPGLELSLSIHLGVFLAVGSGLISITFWTTGFVGLILMTLVFG